MRGTRTQSANGAAAAVAVTTGGGRRRRRRTSGAATPATSAVTAAVRMAVERRTPGRCYRPLQAADGSALGCRPCRAALPELETVILRRGASNGGELRIVLDRPERLNAWNAQLGDDLRAAARGRRRRRRACAR